MCRVGFWRRRHVRPGYTHLGIVHLGPGTYIYTIGTSTGDETFTTFDIVLIARDFCTAISSTQSVRYCIAIYLKIVRGQIVRDIVLDIIRRRGIHTCTIADVGFLGRRPGERPRDRSEALSAHDSQSTVTLTPQTTRPAYSSHEAGSRRSVNRDLNGNLTCITSLLLVRFSSAVFFPGPFPRVCPVRC